ncbi:hypothetical protein BBJ28_00020262 [Nothophytophthora sp. Chile5]|nr:hypothetical protein BBJ28_00020262 [Nothophytophthora sp. Chile5]
MAAQSLTAAENASQRHAELFVDFPEPAVKQVSRLEREAKELANRSLVYGEIPFETVDAVFQLVRPFVDVLDGLHAVALKVLDRWRYQMLDSLPATKADMDVGFIKGDAGKRPDVWQDATLVFCNSTCFSDSSTRWQTMLEQKFPMSWGRATVIVQKKML